MTESCVWTCPRTLHNELLEDSLMEGICCFSADDTLVQSAPRTAWVWGDEPERVCGVSVPRGVLAQAAGEGGRCPRGL